MHKYHYWWSSSWGHTNEDSFRRLGTNDTWTWYKSSLNHIFDSTMSKSSSRWSKWTLGSPNSESGWKNYASGKITDAALSGRSAWLRPAGLDKAGWPGTFLKSLSTQYHCIGDSPIDPQTVGHMTKAKLKVKGLICPSNGLPKWPLEDLADHPRLHLHLHAKKHKSNQCQPLDEA